jgi:hypothetical protein
MEMKRRNHLLKSKEDLQTLVLLFIIVGIVILEGIALFNGVNETQFTLVVIVLAGLGGYGVKEIFGKMNYDKTINSDESD